MLTPQGDGFRRAAQFRLLFRRFGGSRQPECPAHAGCRHQIIGIDDVTTGALALHAGGDVGRSTPPGPVSNIMQNIPGRMPIGRLIKASMT